MLLLMFFLIADLSRTSGFIDIPRAPQYDVSGIFSGSIMYSLPMYSADDDEGDPTDYNVVFRYGFGGRGEVALSMFTPTTFVASVSYLLIKERGGTPAIFGGIDDISYSPYISTVGRDDTVGFLEEKNYERACNGRPPELFSAYIAMQKSFGTLLNVVIGLGRGRFVGYGSRSHIFNTDLFVLGDNYTTEDHSGWAFGTFFGGSITFPFGIELMAEMDGRDGNVGIRYNHKYFSTTFAITKVEHFGDRRPFSPRYAFGLEVSNRGRPKAPKPGAIECIVQDMTSKQLLAHSLVDIKEINKRYRAPSGTFNMSLAAGNYTIVVSKTDYVDYIAKISVKPGIKTKMIFNLKKTAAAIQREAAMREREQSIKNYLEQGRLYFSREDLANAKRAFEMVLSLNPANLEARDYLATIEQKREQLISLYAATAQSRTQAKDYTKALEYWQKVLDLDPGNTDAKTAINRLNTQIAAAKKPAPKPKPAPKTTPKVAKKATKEEVEALFKKGVSHFTAERYDDALKVFNQVLALDPNHSGAKEYRTRTQARIEALRGG
ncbi:MAG: tetratricopeptide repeat protein [candidate division WOR-3 bacterium]|nr:MAG: tetratricopeptide repeat protein [candidate division WOR-3 bacterium]